MQNTNLSGENRLEKPCLVETSQGFSVSYKNRFLYSKYSPKRAITQAIESMTFLPNTLILCASPALWYGLSELLEKLPENCMILGIETDANLFDLANDELTKIKSESKSASKVQMLPVSEIKNIVEILSGKHKIDIEFPDICEFKRAVMIEMSGGTAFNKDFYKEIDAAAENAIAAFWKNRITLTKFGRLFSKNLFKNLSELEKAMPLNCFSGKIEKPILVLGAGEGTGRLLECISAKALEKCFILAVDAVIPTLNALNIRIDGIVAVETQLAIEKAYIGGGAKDSILFADISSRNQVIRHTNKAVSFFASEFAPTLFFEKLSKMDFFPPVIPPLGSVGLTATYLALLLRKNTDTPIFVAGLDFSFSLGATHTKGAPATIQRISSCDRFNPSENYDAAFKIGAQKVIGKNGKIVYTDIALKGYAENFQLRFRNQRNLFDAGETGIDLAIEKVPLENLNRFLNGLSEKSDYSEIMQISVSEKVEIKKGVQNYLEGEEKALERIRELLIYGKDVEKCGSTVEAELKDLISPREYLFLHFPDGFKFDIKNLSQLKRIRTEIDFYLKAIKTGISQKK